MKKVSNDPNQSNSASNSSSLVRVEQAGTNDQNIQKVHAILLREKSEPSEGYKPTPIFLASIVTAVLCMGGVYAYNNSGDLDPLVYDHRYDPRLKSTAGVETKLSPEQFVAAGKRLFGTCASCHQATGAGVPGVFPPLAGSEWVLGNEERLIRVLLHGLNGPIVVKGNNYNGVMPSFGKVPGGGYNWSDEKIAQVLSYIRQDWGNNAALVTKEKVSEILKLEAARDKPWTQAELKAFE